MTGSRQPRTCSNPPFPTSRVTIPDCLFVQHQRPVLRSIAAASLPSLEAQDGRSVVLFGIHSCVVRFLVGGREMFVALAPTQLLSRPIRPAAHSPEHQQEAEPFFLTAGTLPDRYTAAYEPYRGCSAHINEEQPRSPHTVKRLFHTTQQPEPHKTIHHPTLRLRSRIVPVDIADESGLGWVTLGYLATAGTSGISCPSRDGTHSEAVFPQGRVGQDDGDDIGCCWSVWRDARCTSACARRPRAR